MSKNIDDEIEVLSGRKAKLNKSRRLNKIFCGVICILFAVIVYLLFILLKNNNINSNQTETKPAIVVNTGKEVVEPLELDDVQKPYIDKTDTTVVIDDTLKINLSIYEYNCKPIFELARVQPDTLDTTIIFATQAAFIREDGGGILGDYVEKGNKISKGIGASTGFVAIINNLVTIGMDSVINNIDTITPILQQTIKGKGYFFRQYPLVYNSLVVETDIKFAQKPRICRAIAISEKYEVIVVESRDTISFIPFAKALKQIGAKNAVFLPGTNNIFGFYRSYDLNIHYIGKPQDKNIFGKNKKNINWLVWKRK